MPDVTMTTAFLDGLDVDEVAAEANLDALDAADFCGTIWPIAKRGLVLLRDNVFTGGGPGTRVVRWAIGTIIRIVDGRCGS
jgi:hypothetical protein